MWLRNVARGVKSFFAPCRFVNINPEPASAGETLCSLRFAGQVGGSPLLLLQLSPHVLVSSAYVRSATRVVVFHALME